MLNKEKMPREEIELLESWYFHKGIVGRSNKIYNLISKTFPSEILTIKDWEKVSVPHDWDSDGPFLKKYKSGGAGGYAPCGMGWYRKTLHFSEQDKNKKIFLRFDGIYKRSTLWLNGKQIGYQLYGYGPFEIDISDDINYDSENVLYICVNNTLQPSCRWYSGSGIYREVWLIKTNKIYIPWGGVFVSTPIVEKDYSLVNILTEIQNETNKELSITIINQIINKEGNIIQEISKFFELKKPSPSFNISIPQKIEQELKLPNPHLWDIEDPYLYKVKTLILIQDIPIDVQITTFGIRSFKFDGTGFYLNGIKRLMKGANLHHDGGCVGAAVPKDVWMRRLKIWKSIGGNSVRTSHNVPASNFLQCCDELGLLVINEAFDKWTVPPKRGAWGGHSFKKYWKQELRKFIRRDRNHPSVILWSLGNEVAGAYKNKIKRLQAKMHEYTKLFDETRPITAVLSPHKNKRELKKVRKGKGPFYHDIADVYCTNYTEKYLPEIHSSIPNKSIIIAEAHHYYRNKSPEENDLPDSSLHKGCTDINPWYDIEKYDYAVGMFLWVGIEYLGEVRDPYPYHGRTNAPLRITGTKKPQCGFLESVWLERPYVHLAVLDESANIPRGKPQFDFPKIVTHWNFEKFSGEPKKTYEIWTFKNCESIELQLNGRSLGEKISKDYPFNKMTWNVPFEKGELCAIGKNKGKEVTRTSLITAGPPKKISLNIDKQSIRANGKDCAHIEVSLVDENGIINPFANNKITIDVQGEISLIGIDNGDLSDFIKPQAYKQNTCKTYWGRALAIVQSNTTKGSSTIRVSSEGLESAEVEITTK